jgi:hypothetical protein
MPAPAESFSPVPSSDAHPERLVFDRIPLARAASNEIDWPRWSRAIERKRRTLHRTRRATLPATFNRRATLESFRLEGIDLSEADLDHAQAPTRDRRAFRTRTLQRVRNHLAILLSLERCLCRRQSVKTQQIVRWYTSVSSGLSTASLTPAGMERVQAAVHRINSPQMRLQPAVQEIARLHHEILVDPVFPSFNGILARLLLQVHLGRCGLPPIAFDAASDAAKLVTIETLLPRLLELIDRAFDDLSAWSK